MFAVNVEDICTDDYALDESGLVPVDSLDEIEEASDALEETQDLLVTATALEEIQRELKMSAATGDISVAGCNALNLAVEHLCRHSGVSGTPRYACESIQGKQSRRQAAVAAMESISDFMIKLIAKIKEWLARAYELVYDVLAKLFRGAEATARKAVALQKEAFAIRNAGGANKPTSTIKSKKLNAWFVQGNGAMDARAIASAYTQFNKDICNNFSKETLSSAINSSADAMRHSIEHSRVEDYSAEDALRATNGAILSLKNHAYSHFVDTHAAGDDSVLTYALPFGNSSIVATLSSRKLSGGESVFYAVACAFKYADVDMRKATLPALKLDEIIELTGMIEAQMKSGLYREYSNIKTQLKAAGRVVKETCDLVQQTQISNGQANLPSLSFLKSLTGSLLAFTTELYRYNGTVNRQILSYCGVSLSSWK